MTRRCLKKSFRNTSIFFYKSETSDSTMAPFPTRKCILTWFRALFPNYIIEEEKVIHGVLLECPRPAPLWTKLTTKKTGISLGLYHPNLVTRKFFLSQLPPKPLAEELQGMVLFTHATKEETLEVYLEFFRDKLVYLSSFE